VGVNNFVKVVNSPYFLKAFLNLGKYVIITMFCGITIAFGLALLVNRFKGNASNVFRSAYFLPTVIPLFLTAAVWRWILTPDYGLLNRIIMAFGGQSINWLTDPAYMIPAAVIVDVWRSTGFNMIILLAGLNGIPVEYYEAAKVDGANTWQQIFYITIPQLEPVLFLVIVNGFISALQIFDIPWLLTQSTYTSYGGPLQGMLFPVMDIMGRAFGALRFGEASAYAWILLVFVLSITLIQFYLRRRYSRS
jgi:multiple sugar transport system permease protein